MANLLKEAIRLITLWRNHGPNTPKIDLEIIFRDVIVPSSNGDQCKIVYEYFDSFEGMMARIDKSREWRIGINSGVTYGPRRNFTLAHEIGHFIGHRLELDRFECTFDNLNNFQVEGFEKEANEFASNLLMPADVLRTFDKEREFGHAAISELSSMLGVSRSAAAYRWIQITNRQIGFVISRDGFINQGRASEKLFARGIFFKQGNEVPARSLITRLKGLGEILDDIIYSPVWHDSLTCRESSYATTQGGYVYTYLDFDRC